MHLWKNQRRLTALAVSVLILFCGAMTLHPFIPHDHPHEAGGNGSMFTAVHTTNTEKFFVFSFALLFAFSFPLFRREHFLNFQYFIVRIRGKTDTGSRSPLFIALSQGILNTKAH